MRTWLRAFFLVIRTAFVASPWRALVVFTVLPAASLTAVLSGWWLKLLADGVVSGDSDKATFAVVCVAASLTLQHVVVVVISKLRFSLQERTSLRFERELLELVAGLPGLEHHERPEYLDKIEMLRQQRAVFAQAVGAIVMNIGVVGQAVVTGALLWHLHPILLALPLTNVISFITEAKSGKVIANATEASAAEVRLAREHFQTATSYPAAKELRVFGLSGEVLDRHRTASESARTTMVGAAKKAAAWEALGGFVSVLAQMGAILYVLWRAKADPTAPGRIGDVLLTLRLTGQLNGQISGIANATGMLYQTMQVALRHVWLLDHSKAAHRDASGQLPPPAVMRGGIVMERVSFTYPGTAEQILSDVTLWLPPGSVVAVVGDNGAGKSTLVKLLGRFYEPTGGRITVDGVDLRSIDLAQWRSRLSAAFQDATRFELKLGETVGLGAQEHMHDAYRVLMACERSGAGPILEQSPAGLETQLGRKWGGIELSGGQWQRLALARSAMREPLLLLLDEPTANLDAEAEFALFETVARTTRRARKSGAITLLVSHRFSTVRMADVIVVIDGGRVAECGNHAELMAKGGLYAELFTLQSSAYA